MTGPFEPYLRGNRDLWDELTVIHKDSAFYDVAGFKAGTSTLTAIERVALGDVRGRSLLHLQCHFGLDTLSWARLGARVTGVDFSPKAIDLARALAAELGMGEDAARFVCANVYDLTRHLEGEEGRFDIVFTSYGVLAWLPDLTAWAETAARFLAPGGVFFMAEYHPLLNVFDNSSQAAGLAIVDSYFHTPEPTIYEPEGSYADRSASVTHQSHEWVHSLGDVVTALTDAGLRLESLRELPVCNFRWFPFLEQDANADAEGDRWWRLPGDPLPLIFTIKATKPA